MKLQNLNSTFMKTAISYISKSDLREISLKQKTFHCFPRKAQKHLPKTETHSQLPVRGNSSEIKYK